MKVWRAKKKLSKKMIPFHFIHFLTLFSFKNVVLFKGNGNKKRRIERTATHSVGV